MKITLINVSGRMSSDGSRLISALLKRAGHEVSCVFLARREPLEYSEQEFRTIDHLLEESGLVLVAVYTSYAVRAAQITDYVHRKFPGKLVVWGGPHCISVPELGLDHADGVCFSEGDVALLDLVERLEKGQDYLATPNMAFTASGSRVINETLPPFYDLDSLPFYDYTLDDHYLLDGSLQPMTKELLRAGLAGYPFDRPILYTVTSRGCPHKCSYCNNSRYISMFNGNKIRTYSVLRIIAELKHILASLDIFDLVAIGDDDFFVRPVAEIEEFARLYKKEIGLPFGIALSANTFRPEKMEPLLDAGLKLVQMGVQSGSQRVLDEVYNRNIAVSRTRMAIDTMNPYLEKYGLLLLLDFIIDNPYETKEDIMQTFDFILDLPPDIRINVFFLTFFPGTPLFDRALEDGIVEDITKLSFRFYSSSGLNLRYQKNYETLLVLLLKKMRSQHKERLLTLNPLLRLLASRPARAVGSLLPAGFCTGMGRRLQ